MQRVRSGGRWPGKDGRLRSYPIWQLATAVEVPGALLLSLSLSLLFRCFFYIAVRVESATLSVHWLDLIRRFNISFTFRSHYICISSLCTLYYELHTATITYCLSKVGGRERGGEKLSGLPVTHRATTRLSSNRRMATDGFHEVRSRRIGCHLPSRCYVDGAHLPNEIPRRIYHLPNVRAPDE